MDYDLMFNIGIIGAGVSFVLSIIAFWRCRVIGSIKDLCGMRGKSKKVNPPKKQKQNNKREVQSNEYNSQNEERNNIPSSEDELSSVLIQDDRKNSNKNYGNAKALVGEVPNENYIFMDYGQVNDKVIFVEGEITDILCDEGTGMLDENNTSFLNNEDDAEGNTSGIRNDGNQYRSKSNSDGFETSFINEIDIVVTNVDKEI